MYSLNPVQERKSEILKSLNSGFVESHVVNIETPTNPVVNQKNFVSNNIVKSITGEDLLEKANGSSGASGKGEGSRGGKVIGHTSTGKPIYAELSAKDHKGFTPQDHRDAADLYHANGLMGGLQHRLNKHKRNEHHALAEAGGNSLKEREKKSVEGANKPKIDDFDDEEKVTISTLKKEKKAGHTREQAHTNIFGKDLKDDRASKMLDHVFGTKDKTIKKSIDDDDFNKSYEDELNSYELDDRDLIRKGEVLDKLGMGYGGNNALTFTKTGKELKEILPVTISKLTAKKEALELLMEAYIQAAGVDPTEIFQSYSIKSIACKRYPYNLTYNNRDDMGNTVETTDQQKAMQAYNDSCYAWQSLCEDISTCKVILDNIEDSKKYTLSVSQLIALSLGAE